MIGLRKYLQEIIGWAGALFSLTAFSLNSLNIITSQSMQYLLLNVVGCAFLIVYAINKKAHASWVLNSIWLLITAVALVKAFLI
ncbi:CBU_0592 family membrane protein [Rufibacter latericius]|uniref:CBU-0592-like domain-containing protein n=1 Tax=Rufibacter latericius TaxID=2487040 RepID=A0A3M9MB51_9BACT|nr:hypothetical protein [Rufibacter latericius]RNI21788.1 hypothetical protein EFB08_21815 [Rufibacter latericius]